MACPDFVLLKGAQILSLLFMQNVELMIFYHFFAFSPSFLILNDI